MTFQDDWVAFQATDLMNCAGCMWANDFPHSDSTWPWSQDMLAEHTAHLTADERATRSCATTSRSCTGSRPSRPQPFGKS